MIELGAGGWAIAICCALIVGISKSGVPGFAVAAVPLMAMVMPAKESVGAVLGLLILADIFAACYYRRHANWGHVARLLPPTFVGLMAGYFLLGVVSNSQLRPAIGVVVLMMLTVNYLWNKKSGLERKIPTGWWFAAGMGFLVGVTSMMANAAGPMSIIYLLAMRLDKLEFVGTGAWLFFIVNWIKVPFTMSLGLVTAESVKFNLMLVPASIVGVLLGIFLLKRLPQKVFVNVVQILAAVSAVKLIF